MTLKRMLLIAMLVPLALATWSPQAGADKGPVVVQDEMVAAINTGAQGVWDVTNKAMDDNGNPDASKVSAKAWADAKASAARLKAALDRLAQAKTLRASAEGHKIMDEGLPEAATAAEVQARIDADRAGFRKHAADLGRFVASMQTAIGKKDLNTFYRLAGDLDAACEGCHAAYWLKPTNPLKTSLDRSMGTGAFAVGAMAAQARAHADLKHDWVGAHAAELGRLAAVMAAAT